MKPIPENWSAIEAVERDIRKQTGDPNAGFNTTLFHLDGKRRLIIKAEYRKPKGKGFTKSKYDILIEAKYCPFTGKPLYEH